MSRIRTVKPGFFTSEDLSSVSPEAHLLAAGLLCYADDDGFFNANPALIKAALFPLRDTSASIHNMLTELSRIGYVRLGMDTNGRRYGHVVKFSEHQVVNRRTASKIKNLPVDWGAIPQVHRVLSEDSPSSPGIPQQDSLPEGKGMEEERNRDESEMRSLTFDCSAVNVNPGTDLFIERIRKAWFLPDWKGAYEGLIFQAFNKESTHRNLTMPEAGSYVTERMEAIAGIVKNTYPRDQWRFYTIPSVLDGGKYNRPDDLWQIKEGTARQRKQHDAIEHAFS